VDGEVFGRYRLHEVLRWGGMGTVYRAHDTMMTREVAIKVLPANSADEPGFQERFRLEASIAAQLNNPNVIPIYEAGEIDGRLYLVMPVLDGIDAQSLLRRDGPMSPRLAVRVIEQAATALAAAHESGLVHGDVRPSNLFVVGGEFVYLVEFGVAAHAPAADSTGADGAAGTWPYLAPERFSSDTADARTDVYALACVLYECLTGQRAVKGESFEQIVTAHKESEPPKPTDVDPAIPADFDEVVARGMAKNPDDRYQTVLELAFAARDALASAAAAPAPDTGEVEFGRYRLVEMLGQGGMGAVHRARDTALGRDVAVKLLRPDLAAEPGYQERFRREAYAAGRLASPNIIPIYEAGEIDGRLYLVMPIIDGVDVHAVLNRDGPMSPYKAVRVLEQVAAALDAAHKAGLVHRDVKPSNLLMVGDEFVYLIDFGLVHEATAARLTRTNIAPGTPAYMAPERFRSGTIPDARADVYSLACVLYECLTGRMPYSGGGIEGLALAHMSSEVPKPSSVDAAIPVGFDKVVARGMAKEPDDRYQSASELAVAARAALTEVDIDPTQDAALPPVSIDEPAAPAAAPSPPPAEPSGNRNRVLPIAAALAAVVVIAVAAFLGLTNQFPFHSLKTPAQIVLPFTGLDRPLGVAVDTKGNVYVTDTGNNRVVELAAGSTTQTVAPFSGLDHPGGIAVDDRGNLRVTDSANNQVLELTAGATNQTVLPFTDLAEPTGVADYTRNPGEDGAVYVADSLHNRVLKLTAHSTDQTELPFTGLERPSAVAVARDGVLFVIDRENERVLKLPSTATVATVLPYAVGRPDFVAVDAGDNLYVTDSRDNRVMKLVKDSNTSITLPFNGLNSPQGVAVDAAGNIYVADAGNNRVLKFSPS
jgi:serine/threonine protein kinase/sugar lactone lactonase YvrE